MSLNIDLSVAELMSSRICHELVNPVNAVGAGLSLYMEELETGQTNDRALSLVVKSARQTSARLSYYRIAFGLSGGGRGTLAIDNTTKIIADYFESTNQHVELVVLNVENDDIPKEVIKVVLNLLLLAAETAYKGSNIVASIVKLDEGWGIAIKAEGQKVIIRDDIALALRPDVQVSELTARNVQPYFASVLVRSLGSKIELKSINTNTLEIATIIQYNVL